MLNLDNMKIKCIESILLLFNQINEKKKKNQLFLSAVLFK